MTKTLTLNDFNKLLKHRERLFEKLSYYNNPPMFNTINYEPHKNRIRKKIWKINEILYSELNIDKRFYAL